MGVLVRNGIEYGGTGTVDKELSSYSERPLQNKAIYEEIQDIRNKLNEIEEKITEITESTG